MYDNKTYHYIYAGHSTDFPFMERSFLSIVKEIENAIALGKTTIILSNSSERLSINIRKMQRIANHFTDNAVKFVVLTGSIDGKEVYDLMFRQFGWKKKMEIKYVPMFELSSSKQLNRLPITEYNVKTKQKLFLSFNRQAKLHRWNLLYSILMHDLIDKSFFSFEGVNIHEVFNDLNYDENDYHPIIVDNIIEKLPIRLNIHDLRKNPTDIIIDDLHYFNESYFSVVTETIFYVPIKYEYSYKFFSEKIFKPISCKHPFILMAWPFALSELKKLGYKTFSPYINEEYDNIIDDKERFNNIIQELLRLSTLTDDEWLIWQKNVKDVVEHNYEILKTKANK